MQTIRISTAEARAIDQRAIQEFGIPGLVLMENAARNMAELLVRLGARRRVLLLCGRGNNGGDGLAMARHLDRLGVSSRIWLCARLEQLTPAAAIHWTVAERCGFSRHRVLPEGFDSAALEAELTQAEWVVDALFGSGLTGPLRPPFDRIIERVNAAAKSVLAVDVPSGLDADRGVPTGPCIRAAHTAVTIAERTGFAVPGAERWLGTIHVVDIGLPGSLLPSGG